MDDKSNDQRLTDCFQTAGKKHGFDSVNAEFMAFKDFKVRWQRSYRWADFKVSDYLNDAPDEVLTSLAESLFERILGEDDGYSKELHDWVTSPKFHEMKQDLYLTRSKNLTRSVIGDSKNLQESYDRLIGAGLVPYDPTIALSWTKDCFGRKSGNCSVLMRVVYVSKALDADDVPDYVLDYALYHELCHLMIGFDPTGELHADKMLGLENRFLEREDALQWLRRICVFE